MSKDELEKHTDKLRELLNRDDVWNSEYNGVLLDIEELLAKDRQQLIQRIREEVIGEDEKVTDWERPLLKLPTDSVKRNELRQTQREKLETMEKS